MLLSIAFLAAHIVAIFTGGFGGRIDRRDDLLLVTGYAVFFMIAGAWRFGADVWDRRLLPWNRAKDPR